MKMTQQEMAEYTAHRLATACFRNPANMQRMRDVLRDLERCDEAVDAFAGQDDEAHAAVTTMRSHHLKHIDRKSKKPVFDMAGADATWRMTRLAFDRHCRTELLLPCEDLRDYARQMAAHFRK